MRKGRSPSHISLTLTKTTLPETSPLLLPVIPLRHHSLDTFQNLPPLQLPPDDVLFLKTPTF